eukprot:358751-Chlamydomonas_euryale.AAC.3
MEACSPIPTANRSAAKSGAACGLACAATAAGGSASAATPAEAALSEPFRCWCTRPRRDAPLACLEVIAAGEAVAAAASIASRLPLERVRATAVTGRAAIRIVVRCGRQGSAGRRRELAIGGRGVSFEAWQR